MAEIKFLPYGKQSVTADDIREVVEVLESDWLTRGPKVSAFEETVADYCGASFAVAFPNGTIALEAACYAANVGRHDRLVTSPNTFVATAGAGVKRGATPVFVDIDRSTGNLDLDQVGYTIESRSTRGRNIVMPVHFGGISVDMAKLEKMIKDPDTVVIEDAAHALGSRHPDGSLVGSCRYSDMTIFSFHPVKTITSGEGGMVTTNDEELCRRLKLFRNNGIVRDPPELEGEPAPWYYEVQDITGNYNFTDIQAALGLSQFRRLDKIVEKRRSLVSHYRKELQDYSRVRMFTDEYDADTAFHLFVVQIDFAALDTTRTQVMTLLMNEGIGSQLHYIPVYRHPVFRHQSEEISEYFPSMEAYYSQALSLPLFYDMEEGDVTRVVEALKKVLGEAG